MAFLQKVRPLYWEIRSTYRLATHNFRLFPEFIILGTQRGGTTSLYYYLTTYGDIGSALHKEVHFFDDHYQKGLRWYQAQFPTTLQKHARSSLQKRPFMTGESSPYYLFHPRIPQRVKQALPRVKLIVLLRNPVDRAYSHHWLATHEGFETLPFAEAIAHEAERLAGEEQKILADEQYESFNHRHYSYLARGIYAAQLENWLRFFPREQLLILQSEEFYAHPIATVKQTLDFLQMPSHSLDTVTQFKQYREPTPKGYLNNQKPARMDSALRSELNAYFKPHNARLYKLLEQDFGWDNAIPQ